MGACANSEHAPQGTPDYAPESAKKTQRAPQKESYLSSNRLKTAPGALGTNSAIPHTNGPQRLTDL